MSKRKIKFLAKIVCEYELHRYAVDVQNLEWLYEKRNKWQFESFQKSHFEKKPSVKLRLIKAVLECFDQNLNLDRMLQQLAHIP